MCLRQEKIEIDRQRRRHAPHTTPRAREEVTMPSSMHMLAWVTCFPRGGGAAGDHSLCVVTVGCASKPPAAYTNGWIKQAALQNVTSQHENSDQDEEFPLFGTFTLSKTTPHQVCNSSLRIVGLKRVHCQFCT